MEIFSKIKIVPVRSQVNKCRAFVTVCFGELVFITGIKVVEGAQGLFVSFPSRTTSAQDHQKIAWLTNKALFERLEKEILDKYLGMAKVEATIGTTE